MDNRRKADRRTQDRLLTEHQVADMAAVPLRTVRHWRQTGVLPSVRIGRHPRVWLSDFMQLFQKTSPLVAFEQGGVSGKINDVRDIRRKA
jgi:excisionase family DNA binding protein